MSDAPIIERRKLLSPNQPAIDLLRAVLEDAEKGGVTSVAMVTVDGSGLRIQTPAQFYQVREILYGVEELRKKLIMEFNAGASGVIDGFRNK